MDIRRHFQDLVNLGFGIVRGIGKHLEWCFSQNVDIDDNKVDANVDRKIKSQSYSYNYVSDINSANVDNIDKQLINPNQNIENRLVDTKQMVDVNKNVQNKSIKANQSMDKSLIENEVKNNQRSVSQKEYLEKNKEKYSTAN